MSSVTRTIRKPYNQGFSQPEDALDRKFGRSSDQDSETFYQSPEDGTENQGAEPNEDGEFEVEAILEKKVKRGQAFYKVKWKGYDLRHVTWEPEENLKNAPEKIEIFEKGLLRMPTQVTGESPSDEAIERKMTLLRKREWQDLRSKRRSQTPNNPDDEPADEESDEAGLQQGRKIVKTNLGVSNTQGQGLVQQRVEDGRYLNNPQNHVLDYLKMSNMVNLNKDAETEAKSLEKSKDFKVVLQSELDKYRKENQESIKAFSSLLPNQNSRQPTFAMSIEEQLKALNNAPLRDRNVPANPTTMNLQDNALIPNSFGQNNLAANPALSQFNPQYPFPGTPDLYSQYLPMCNPLVDPLFTGSMNYLNNPLLTANDLALRNLITFQGSFQISNYLLPPTNPTAFNPNRLGGFLPPNGFDPTQNLLAPNSMNMATNLALPAGDPSMNGIPNQNQQKALGMPMVDPLGAQLMYDPMYLSAFKTPPIMNDLLPKSDPMAGNNMLKGKPNPLEGLMQMQMKPVMPSDKVQQNFSNELLKRQTLGQSQQNGKILNPVNNNAIGINELNKSKGFTVPNK